MVITRTKMTIKQNNMGENFNFLMLGKINRQKKNEISKFLKIIGVKKTTDPINNK